MKSSRLFSDPQHLPYARLDWRNGVPVALDYDDIYAASDDVLAEKEHVFLRPNRMLERARSLIAGEHVSVLELGFGGGLNFLLTWHLWNQSQSQGRLIYTSIEGHPMSLADLCTYQAQWSPLFPLAQQLQHQYPLPIKGFHQLCFTNITLNLILGSVAEALPQICGRVNAIYLDGFSPARNEAMWQAHLMQQIANLCDDQTTLATYSAARIVKTNLAQAGFVMRVATGFGPKRHQLSGTYQPVTSSTQQYRAKAVYVAPWQRSMPSLRPGARIAVIGAGIAGCSTAQALEQQGFDVQIIEQQSHVAQGASGNRQGVLYAKLPDSVTVAGQLHQQGLQFSIKLLSQTLAADYWQACGLFQVATDKTKQAKIQRFVERGIHGELATWLDADAAQIKVGLAVADHGIWCQQAGWVVPTQWCRRLLQDVPKLPWFNTQLVGLQFNAAAGKWSLYLQGEHAQTKEYEGVVLCNAYQANMLMCDMTLPLTAIRGQVSYFTIAHGPKAVVCGEGYATPAYDGVMTIGASYNLDNISKQISAKDHAHNLHRLQTLLPNTEYHQNHITGGRVSFRASTPDYLPMVGLLADGKQIQQRFAHLRKDRNYRFQSDMPWLPGLYINAGHGSKGLITAPLSAQLLAAQMTGQSWPISKHLASALDPNRFCLRDMTRPK